MIFLQGIISGLFATIIFDLYQSSLKYAYDIEKPKWNLLGRYFLGYKENKFIRKNLIDDEEVDDELLWGWKDLLNGEEWTVICIFQQYHMQIYSISNMCTVNNVYISYPKIHVHVLPLFFHFF